MFCERDSRESTRSQVDHSGVAAGRLACVNERMHANKHVRDAIRYALALGWRVRAGGGHAFCV
ncbi:MAG: hypothetical protein RLZZ21_2321, partial [Planctomycetota bacterium]